MRILHLLASPWWTGPAENVALLALAQRALGHEVSVAVDRLRGETPAEEPLAPRLKELGLLDEGGLVLSVKGSPLDALRDMRRLRGRALDLVHCHFSHDHWIAAWGRPKGAKVVRSLHAPRSIRRLMPRADMWTVPYEAMAHRLVGRRVTVLPTLVDPSFTLPDDRAELRRELGLEGSPLVGMVSTFQPSRRHALGLEAFALLVQAQPEARLLLVGDGALEGEIRARVKEMGIEHAVTFAGYQSGEAFVRRLQALDVVWILGLGNDWSARAAAQARACGVRVVSVDEGALSRWADRVVEPDARAISAATREASSRVVSMPDAVEVAGRLLAQLEPRTTRALSA